jgi:hypothetical protein
VSGRVTWPLLASIGVALALGVVARSAPARVPLSFARPVSYEGGPFVVMVSDLNRDGRLDLVSDGFADAVVELNLGGGRFGQAAYYGTGESAGRVEVGDLDGDGAPELVVERPELSRLAVLENRGDGTFAAPSEFQTGLEPIDVAIGDLNGDGVADLATANMGGNTASALLNRGDGTFLPYVDYAVGRRPGSIRIRDLDGNGRADLVVTNVSSNTVSVLLNRGDGSFQARSDYATGRKPGPVSVADLNADGHPDLVTANETDNTVSVLVNRGDGTFAPRVNYATGRRPALVVGDLNADGAPDLATANFASSTVSVLRNHGDGTFARKADFPTGPNPAQPAVGDLNGDGSPDLVAINTDEDQVLGEVNTADTATVLLNRGYGTFERRLYYATGYPTELGGQPLGLALADLNADGRLDLAATNIYYPSGEGDVAVVLNRPGLCDVQRVTRMTLADVGRTLARVNCRLGKVRRAYSKRVKKGLVISQSPPLGTVRPNGSRVNVVVSKGRRR